MSLRRCQYANLVHYCLVSADSKQKCRIIFFFKQATHTRTHTHRQKRACTHNSRTHRSTEDAIGSRLQCVHTIHWRCECDVSATCVRYYAVRAWQTQHVNCAFYRVQTAGYVCVCVCVGRPLVNISIEQYTDDIIRTRSEYQTNTRFLWEILTNRRNGNSIVKRLKNGSATNRHPPKCFNALSTHKW